MSWTSVDLLTESLSNIGGCRTGLRFFTSLEPYRPRPSERNAGYCLLAQIAGCGTMPAWAKAKGDTLESYRVT